MAKKRKFTFEEIERWFEEEETQSQSVVSPPGDPAEKYARSQLRVVRETKDYQLDYLRHALQPGKELIDTSPAYQRRLRWTNNKRSLLIESFLLNIPVPPIFLFERDYNEYEVIDGRQRLDTIREYLANNFSLSGLEYWPELNRCRFNDLPMVLQRGLLRRSLSAVVLLAESTKVSPDGLDIRHALFERLNTGGIRLNPQELRNALNPGPLNALLIRLARSEPFAQIWGIPAYAQGEEDEPSDRLLKNPLFASMADAELVLRFFALRDAMTARRSGSLRRLLDRFMQENANAYDSVLIDWDTEFRSLIVRLYDLFEGQPFRLPVTNRASRPLYDAMMIALSLNPHLDLHANATAIRQDLNTALRDPAAYDVLVGRGNTIEAVRSRVDLAGMILNARSTAP